MTIQLPILLWTVISFCVLMLLLNRLLFKPLLAFMDARQDKINRARAAREAATKAQADARQAAEDARLSAQKHARDAAAAALDAARNAAMQESARLTQSYAEQLAQTKAAIEKEKQAIAQQLNAGMDELVSAFTGKLAQ